VVVIIGFLQLVPITTKVVSSNPTRGGGGRGLCTQYNIQFVSDLWQDCGCPQPIKPTVTV